MSVFLSYSRGDEAFAKQLRESFEQQGVEFVDYNTSIPPGISWAQEIERKLKEADAVILVVPQSGSIGANGVFFEVGAAHALGKRVVAVVPPDQNSGSREVPSDLQAIIYSQASPNVFQDLAALLRPAKRDMSASH